MCGIAGIIDFKHKTDPAVLRRMIGLVRHRGPDSAGMYQNGPAGLAHARLSIIDLSASGDQPIHNEDKTIWIIFNGEIFNYPELRESLVEAGHRFYTHTDTEILVHLYEAKGLEMFADLNGQFAFAIWDQRKEQLIVARDRVGIRPFFFYNEPGRLVFGSEIKSIFADPNIPRRIDAQTLSDVFTCWAPTGCRSAFEGIHQLPPAHYAVFSRDGLALERYWSLRYHEEQKVEARSIDEWAEELKSILMDASKIRLRADVPVGAYLSGGIDSTFTSALVKKHFNNRLCTFSVGFSDKRFDESDYQRIAIEALKTDHNEIVCKDADIGEIFPRVIWHTETPIIRTAPAPLFQLSKLVRQHDYKVVLTGEGADEIFAGYNIFKEDKVRRFWSKFPESNIRPLLLRKLYPYVFTKDNEKAQKFLISFFKKNMEAVASPVYSHMLRWQNTSQLKNFFSADMKRMDTGIEDFTARMIGTLPDDFMRWSPLSRAQYLENTIFLSNYLLSSQGDRMAMAHSVEGRYPFLDYRVIEFACRLPHKLRLNGMNEKFILKKAATGLIPEALVKRPKQPYRAPISNCFFGETTPEYVSFLMSETTIKDKGYFDPKKVSRLIEKCKQGKGQLLSERENMAVVAILSTQLLDHLFIRNFPGYPVAETTDVKIFN